MKENGGREIAQPHSLDIPFFFLVANIHAVRQRVLATGTAKSVYAHCAQGGNRVEVQYRQTLHPRRGQIANGLRQKLPVRPGKPDIYRMIDASVLGKLPRSGGIAVGTLTA